MIRTTLFFVFAILSLQLEAQNVVQNGGFEDIRYCPNSPGQIQATEPWTTSGGSPDLFNECGTLDYNVPFNKVGFQDSRSGEGYAAFATYSEDGVNTREFMQNQLSYALIEGENYYVEFHVSQTDSMQFATHNIGVVLTDYDPPTSLECYPGCEVYFENTSSNPLTSKTDWIKISGTFTAQGGERYLHIGNFRTDADSEIEFVGGGVRPWIAWNQSAYYIDDVWLSHIDSMGYVGVNEQLPMSNEQYLVYPNPSSGAVTVDYACSGNDKAELQVFDMSGRQVYRNSNVCGANAIELAGLADGIYHCLLTINGSKQLSEKLVILRE